MVFCAVNCATDISLAHAMLRAEPFHAYIARNEMVFFTTYLAAATAALCCT